MPEAGRLLNMMNNSDVFLYGNLCAGKENIF